MTHTRTHFLNPAPEPACDAPRAVHRLLPGDDGAGFEPFVDRTGMAPAEIAGRGAQDAGCSSLSGESLHATPVRSATPQKSTRQYQEAARRLQLVQSYEQLLAQGFTPNDAAKHLNAQGMATSRPSLDRYRKAYQEGGFEGLLDNREKAGRPRKYQLTPAELDATRRNYLITNRTATSGSVPEAVRMASRQGLIRPELAEAFRERQRTGPIVPRSIAAEIPSAPAVVKQHRNPSDANLDYLNAPGALMWVKDERTGEERFVRVGDILEADDATINFPVCVPWEIGGDPCSERWGVRVGRFQWLVAIDRASRFVPGWSYTMRPRASYRAEDVVALFHGIFRAHGIWQRLCLERGVWEADQVSQLLENLGIQRKTAWSPHQKPFIEGLFNLMWTKLSDMPGQVGRYQGEEEETNHLLESCRRGASDPRIRFPMLADALQALGRAVAERNEQPVQSQQYGNWVPQERWLAQQAEARTTGRLRPLPEEAAWMFAPCVREWTVQGGLVGGSVQVMDGLSVRFDFAAEWLVNYAGAKVRVHFDPAAPEAIATVVLAQNVRDVRSGQVLGTAWQVNKTARYARRALGWGSDPDLGVEIRQQQAAALRREVRAVAPGRAVAVSESRNGLGESTRAELVRGDLPATPAKPAGRRRNNPFAPATPEQFEQQQKRLSRMRAALTAVEEVEG